MCRIGRSLGTSVVVLRAMQHCFVSATKYADVMLPEPTCAHDSRSGPNRRPS